MLSASSKGQAPERVLIASANPEERRHIGEVARLAGLRAIGFVREPEQVVTRTALSNPDVLLLDVDLLLQLQKQRTSLESLHLGPAKTILFGQRLSKQMATRWKAEGFHGTLDLQNATEKPVASYAHDLRTALDGLSAQQTAAPVCLLPRQPEVVGTRKVLPPSSVVIGSSTGGPVALLAVLKALPASFPLPIAVVQHMPPGFTAMLAERLHAECPLEVVEARSGMPFHPGCVFIAPGGSHMVLQGSARAPRIALNTQPPENSCRPAVDVLFRSSAEVFGGNQHAIVLTGMGRDGLNGAMQLHDLGSRIVVQDAATSTVWGMPGAIAQAGYADDILPLDGIAPQLLRCL
jgi:chemotaxis response regulator CheB